MKEKLLEIFRNKHKQGDNYYCYQSKKKNWIVGYSNDYPLQHGKGIEWVIPEEVAELLVGQIEPQVSLGDSQPVLLAENKKLKEILINTYQFLGDLPELNINNYNEEEVSELNLGVIQIYQKLQPYYDEYFSKQSN